MNTEKTIEIPDKMDTVSYLGYWVSEKAKLEKMLARANAEIERARES